MTSAQLKNRNLFKRLRIHMRWRLLFSPVGFLFVLLVNAPSDAATCTWHSAVAENWHLPSNWSGCVTGNGSPAGTPGSADDVIVPSASGAALLNSQFTTIASLTLQSGATLGVVESQIDIRQLTINNSFSLNNATVSGAMPPPGGPTPATLSVQLPASAHLILNGTNLLRRSIITNAGQAVFNGSANARLNMEINGSYTNAVTGTTTINGAYVFGYSPSGVIDNQGSWIIQGPGIVALERSGTNGGQFNSNGPFEVRNATFKRLSTGTGFLSGFSNSAIRLLDAVFDAGNLDLGVNKSLSGTGTVIGNLTLSGSATLDLFDSEIAPIGQLNVVGNAQFNFCEIILDVSGPGLVQHDRLSVSGSSQWNQLRPRIRINDGYTPGIDTSIPIASHGSLVFSSAPVNSRVFSDYPLSLMLRTTPTQLDLRVVPTLTIAKSAIDEGNSGTQTMPFAIALSAPTVETVSFSFNTSAGTAVTLAVPPVPGDYNNTSGNVSLAPGEVSQVISILIKGDSVIEGDEAFSLVTENSSLTTTLRNASFGNNKKFGISVEGLILNDDGPTTPRTLLISKSTNQPTPTGQISFVRRYTTDGNLVDGWATNIPNSLGFLATGLCRAPNGEVLSTRFNAGQGPILMSKSGAILENDFAGLIGADESCAFDLAGNVWIGEAVPPSESFAALRYAASDGLLLKTLQVPVGERGTDWIELDAKQCIIFYTSEDSDVRRFDVCNEQALPHFATGLEAPCYAIRQLPNRDLMITCKNRIYRYDDNGVFIREYTRESLGETNVDGLYAIHLDPDGQTFWTGGVISGRVVRARLDTGAVITSFNTGTGGVNGLLLQDEFVAGISVLLFKDGFE